MCKQGSRRRLLSLRRLVEESGLQGIPLQVAEIGRACPHKNTLKHDGRLKNSVWDDETLSASRHMRRLRHENNSSRLFVVNYVTFIIFTSEGTSSKLNASTIHLMQDWSSALSNTLTNDQFTLMRNNWLIWNILVSFYLETALYKWNYIVYE